LQPAREPQPIAQPQISPDVFVGIGQSLVVGASTQNQDVATGHVNSLSSVGLVSESFRNQYGMNSAAKWIDANDWPCADAQCAGSACGSPGGER